MDMTGIGSGGQERAGLDRDGLSWLGELAPVGFGWVGLVPAGLRSDRDTWPRSVGIGSASISSAGLHWF